MTDINTGFAEQRRFIVVQFRRYASIFTVLGVILTGTNLYFHWYTNLTDRALQLTLNGALIEKQIYLANSSKGGRCYKKDTFDRDPAFNSSLKVLMNFYEGATGTTNPWWGFRGGFDDAIMCPLGKHVEIFLLGKSRPDYWQTDGAFFAGDVFAETRATYDRLQPRIEKECPSYWVKTEGLTCD